MEVQAGQHIAGHRLLTRIARGHYGEVWKAEFYGQPVALKLFTRYLKINRECLHRKAFAQYALGRLKGDDAKYFPRVEHVDMDARPPWIRMELIEGRPLDLEVEDPQLSLENRLDFGRRILEAVAIIHREGFVHGDLSPMNVLVTDKAMKLIDVGFGAVFEEGNQDMVVSTTKEDRPMGVASPMYAAPERFKAEFLNGCGKQSDVFSFGKVLYRLITGETPFVIKPVSVKFPVLGKPWDDFIFKCLEEKPEDRFADAEEALAEYVRIFQTPEVEGDYLAECPECKASKKIPGGWAGERFRCSGCQLTLEVLFYDDEGKYAATALVNDYRDADEVPEIQFIEEGEEPTRGCKFCPACGGGIGLAREKCGRCQADVDETAKKIVIREMKVRAAERAELPERRSFGGPALIAFFGFFLFWLPGAILTWHYLEEANRVEQVTGEEPPGYIPLMFMMWSLVYLPLFGLGFLLLLAIFGGGLSFMLGA